MTIFSNNHKNLVLLDAIKLDHSNIRQCFVNFRSATSELEKEKWANEFIRKVSVHSAAEEISVYPVMQKRLEGGMKIADQSRDEHQLVKNELYELDKMALAKDPELFNQRINHIMAELDHHMQEEENELLPKLQNVLTSHELSKLKNEYASYKPVVPTHPHPSAPNQPPAEILVGMAQSPIDRAYDAAVRSFPEVK